VNLHLRRRGLNLFGAITLFAALAAVADEAGEAVSQAVLPVEDAAFPRVLFLVSNDHALYYKAYTDWNDLSGDGVPDTGYTHTITYYGYFDSTKCYDYVNNRFEPKAVTATTADPNAYCDGSNNGGGRWSGNFLNWATMSRMDIVRKVLYGGMRSSDTASETVLERAFIPTDAHSFAKYHENLSGEIARLTPFEVQKLTLCNTTYAGSGESQNVTAPPLIRAARGDFRYWAANERWQCTWSNEHGSNSSGSNTTESKTVDPVNSSDKYNEGLGSKDYIARVKVCVAGLLGKEDCKLYPDSSSNYKPVGLLHNYGEDGSLLFGLMTRSYAKNKSGGVLRKNIRSFADEVNPANGTFTRTAGFVATLDKFRIVRYNYGEGVYNISDDCYWGLATFTEGDCSNWGNPLSEMYLEALRYFAGLGKTDAFTADDSSYLAGLGTETWSDPLTATDAEHTSEWCAQCSLIVINASEPSYDHDSFDATGLKGPPVVADETTLVGGFTKDGVHYGEYINSTSRFVGENGTDNNQLCTAKTVTNLGSVLGACPGAPRLSGTYYVAGLAHWARTNDIRTDDAIDQSVATRAVTLLPAAPKLTIPVPGRTSTVSILPACRSTKTTPNSNCMVVDFKIIEQNLSAGTGKVYINWEDSEQGGDYDQDMKGTLSYTINTTTNTIKIDTQVNRKSTDHALGFGYVISGTTKDGFHVHSGINRFVYPDATAVTTCKFVTSWSATFPSCTKKSSDNKSCTASDYTSATPPPPCDKNCSNCDANTTSSEADISLPVSSYTFTLGTSTATLLNEPLWYAAKYGSFIDTDSDQYPNGIGEWDSNNDGYPDGFFFASNPGQLGPSLKRFLDVISTTTSSAAVAANSITLQTSTRIYQARFDSKDWSGDLVASPLAPDGSIMTPVWSAKGQLQNQSADERCIITSTQTEKLGVPFLWGDTDSSTRDGIDPAQMLLLCPTCTPEADTVGRDRLNFLRGDYSVEGGSIRRRAYVLGDLVNSEPLYVGAPIPIYPETIAAASYQTFAQDWADRLHMLYIGGNDGMLHGFRADSGGEQFGYVPRAVYPNLAALAAVDYTKAHRYYVDGGPRAQDAWLATAAAWRTVLVSGLGAGGAGVFALDITNPDSFEAQASAMDKVLWDLTASDAGFENLGYSFSRPAVVRLPDDNFNGLWAVAFGNGYGNTAATNPGKASLFIVDVETGALLTEVVADLGPKNGLSSVAPVDYNGDFKVDYIYAGDLKGNLWRFEPYGSSSWRVSFNGKPLFAGTAPITTRPEVIAHPLGGVMVLFGTGSYYRVMDRTPDLAVVNAFFGIWDRIVGEASRTNGGADIRISHLLQQEIIGEGHVGDFDIRLTTPSPTDPKAIIWFKDIDSATGHPVDTPPASHLGWYINLLYPKKANNDPTGYGEMQVTEPQLRGARVVFTTMIPSTVTCAYGGDGWLMELNALDGARISEVVFDLNHDGDFNVSDMATISAGEIDYTVPPSGKKSKVGIIQRPAVIAAGAREYKYASGAKEAGIEATTESASAGKVGRRSWLELH